MAREHAIHHVYAVIRNDAEYITKRQVYEMPMKGT